MYRINVEIRFAAGHYLLLPHGLREKPHRHNWRVRAQVESAQLDEFGFVMDFHVLQEKLHQIVKPFSLAEYMNDLPEFTQQQPSTERIAHYIYIQLKSALPKEVILRKLTVWETDDCYASYHVNHMKRYTHRV